MFFLETVNMRCMSFFNAKNYVLRVFCLVQCDSYDYVTLFTNPN